MTNSEIPVPEDLDDLSTEQRSAWLNFLVTQKILPKWRFCPGEDITVFELAKVLERGGLRLASLEDFEENEHRHWFASLQFSEKRSWEAAQLNEKTAEVMNAMKHKHRLPPPMFGNSDDYVEDVRLELLRISALPAEKIEKSKALEFVPFSAELIALKRAIVKRAFEDETRATMQARTKVMAAMTNEIRPRRR